MKADTLATMAQATTTPSKKAAKKPTTKAATKRASKSTPPAKRANAEARTASPRQTRAKITAPPPAAANPGTAAPVARDRGVLILGELLVEQWVKHKTRVGESDVAFLGRYGHLPSEPTLERWLSKFPQDKDEPGWTTAAHARLALVFATQGDDGRARRHLDAAHASLPPLPVTRMVAADHLAQAHAPGGGRAPGRLRQPRRAVEHADRRRLLGRAVVQGGGTGRVDGPGRTRGGPPRSDVDRAGDRSRRARRPARHRDAAGQRPRGRVPLGSESASSRLRARTADTSTQPRSARHTARSEPPRRGSRCASWRFRGSRTCCAPR